MTVGARPPRAAIFGCSGPRLSGAERRFFSGADPLGFILFQRNCVDPGQVRELVRELRAAVGRAGAPVLIDQEGGRVQRLKPPHWRQAPPAATFAHVARHDRARALEAARLNARLIAAELHDLGVTVDCAPVLDVPAPGSHPVIGDRACGDTAELVAHLGAAACAGLLDGGVLPAIKHIPGHGRATLDSHAGLPRVAAPRPELERVDFAPFRALAAMPWAMTAHVLYEAIDAEAPATLSRRVIEDVVRGWIGFRGFLVTDDVSMGALAGALEERVSAALAAGCDAVLHCNGDGDEMEAVARAAPPLGRAALDRLGRAESMRIPPRPFDREAALGRLAELAREAAA